MQNKLKEERIAKGYTQQDFAQMVGVSRQSIIAIESGRYVPSTILALKMAACLGLQIEQLFMLEEED